MVTAETDNPACMGCPHPASSHRGSTCIECGDAKPLGIWELVRDFIGNRNTPEFWYWCRKHEKAERSTEPADIIVAGAPTHYACVRIGPFMTEREANRLQGSRQNKNGFTEFGLGMRVET